MCTGILCCICTHIFFFDNNNSLTESDINMAKKKVASKQVDTSADAYEELSLDDIDTIDDGTKKLESQISGDDINGELDDCDDELLKGD